MIELGFNIFWKFADENFVICLLILKELMAPDQGVKDWGREGVVEGATHFFLWDIDLDVEIFVSDSETTK